MKHPWLLIALAFFPLIVFGQVVIDKKNFPDPGDLFAVQRVLLKPNELPRAVYDLSHDTFNIDLSYLSGSVSSRDTEMFIPAKQAPGGNDVAGAEFAFKASFGHGFFRRNGNELLMTGVSPADNNLPTPVGFKFDKPLAHFQTPIVFGDSYKDSTGTERSFIVIKVEVSVNASYEANGYGKLTIPGGKEFDVLRLRRKYLFQVTSKPLVGEPSVTIDSLVTWEFYAKDIPNTILRVDARIVGKDTISYYDFYEDFLSVDIQKVNAEEQPIFQLVQGNKLKATSTVPGNVFIYGLNGKLLLNTSIAKGTNYLDLNALPKGIYVARLEERSGRITNAKFFKPQ